MRTIVHLSDLHFGRTDPAVLGPLTGVVIARRPDLVVVSGDLTQRARSREFRDARAFLDALPSPRIVVPGNHDVPLHNPLARFLGPLRKYRRHITDDLEPLHLDDEVVVAGVNTARSFTTKHGRVNERQVDKVRQRFEALPDRVVKVVVSHHPFDVREDQTAWRLVGRAPMARTRLLACGADLVLAGHFHVGGAGRTAVREDESGRAVVVVQAGTATSTRSRGERNSFNVLRIEAREIEVERLAWHPDRGVFAAEATDRFRRASGGWTHAAESR